MIEAKQMTDIVEQRAVTLLNKVAVERSAPSYKRLNRNNHTMEALYRAIEQREAFKQEVSDAVESAIKGCGPDQVRSAHIYASLHHLILPKPKPDPLVEVAESMGYYDADAEDMAEELRAALKAQGLEIKEISK